MKACLGQSERNFSSHYTYWLCSTWAESVAGRHYGLTNHANTVQKGKEGGQACEESASYFCYTFTAKQKQKKKTSTLKLPSKTRWGGTVIMYNSLIDGKESLQELAIMESLDVDASIRKVLLDNDISWARIASSLKVLEPIASAIEKVESDEALLSDVQRLFVDLQAKVTAALPESPLLKSEEKSVIDFINNRRDFCIKPIHGAAYMLDPKCHESHDADLSEEQINSAYVVISAIARHLHLNEGKVMASLAKFRAKDGLWSGEGVWASAEHISAATWWKGLCRSEAVSPIASVILQIPPTSALSERNWSLFGNTHTKTRNRLTNDRVEKLVAIRSNLKLFEPTEDKSTQVDSDDEIVVSSSESDEGTIANWHLINSFMIKIATILILRSLKHKQLWHWSLKTCFTACTVSLSLSWYHEESSVLR